MRPEEIGKAARAKVEIQFDARSTAARYASFYNEILGEEIAC